MIIAETKHRATGPQVGAGCSARGIVGSNELLGLTVIDSRKECIGTLSDIMFDLHTGRLAYGVVALDRAPQWSERLIAIPWNAMHLDSEGEHLCVNALRDWIERAPSMQADAMPNLLDHECAVLIHSFFGTKPYWETGSQQHS
jgi:sporulation protein YlmC with PRC-barrel domain